VNQGGVYAVFDYERGNNDELMLTMGERYTVLKKGDEHEKDWWWARKDASEEYGYIPKNLLGVGVLELNVEPSWGRCFGIEC